MDRKGWWSRAVRAAVASSAATAILPVLVFGQASGEGEWWAGIDRIPNGVTVLEVDSTYAVEGSTVEEIRLDLQAKGPESGGRRFHGLAHTNWRYQYRTRRLGSGGCRLQSLKVLVRSVITLPSLANPPRVPEEIRNAFAVYLERLREHEEGHRVIAVTKIYEFRNAAERLVFHDCEEVGPTLSELSREVGTSLRPLQADYDAVTEHGKTQGATWPPRGGAGTRAPGPG